ncbi:MAG: hypothetical protein JXP34_18945 [Planctomycetes bacterium]|nr:hypothetical protein [Planctomycetota bacterium]
MMSPVLAAGANILIQSAIIIGCGLALSRLARRRAAALESAVLRATIAAVLLCPALGLVLGGIKRPLVTVRVERPAAPAAPAAARAAPGDFGSAGLAGLWILASTVLVARLGWAGAFIARLRRFARPARDSMAARCADLAARIGVKAPPVLESRRVRAPLLAGVRSPAIVLPEGDAGDEGEAIDAALLHELAHLKRRDVAWNGLAHLARALLFFQPLVWLLARRLEDASDLACDDTVVACGLRPKAYAHALLAWAARERPSWREALAGAGVIRFRSSLGQRVARILDGSLPRALHARVPVIAIVLLAGAGIGATGLLGFQDRETVRTGERRRDAERSRTIETERGSAPREIRRDRPREGDRPRDAERPREGDRERAESRREGDGERAREGERKRERDEGRRAGDRATDS